MKEHQFVAFDNISNLKKGTNPPLPETQNYCTIFLINLIKSMLTHIFDN
jgi:hypothetical protein